MLFLFEFYVPLRNRHVIRFEIYSSDEDFTECCVADAAHAEGKFSLRERAKRGSCAGPYPMVGGAQGCLLYPLYEHACMHVVAFCLLCICPIEGSICPLHADN